MVSIVSAEDGDKIVRTALDVYGGVHVLVANAGFVRSNTFAAMTDGDWDDIIAGNLRWV